MVNVTIEPATRLHGTARVPGDKSIAHRALICGALANGWTRIIGVPRSADVSTTIRALNDCGVQTQRNDDVVIVNGAGRNGWRAAAGATIDCANSGTTMRLLTGVLAGQPGRVRLVGDASLSRRPMRRVAEPLMRMGAQVLLSGDGVAPLQVIGSALSGIEYDLATPSAQVKSALMFAGLSATGGTTLRGRTDSRDHTERMLPRFGASVDVRDGAISVEGGQRMRGIFIEIPGDPSSAAFWIAAACLVPGSRIELHDVNLNPTRTGFIEVLQRMGASIETQLRRREPEPVGTIRVESSSLRAATLSASDVPSLVDELPLLAVVATQAEGTTIIRGAAELRLKESDRIEAIAGVLRAMGAQIETFDDGFAIAGKQALQGATIDPAGDHRIAMAGSIAALIAHGSTMVQNAECVGVSYPAFFSTLGSLGATVQS